MNGRRLAAVAVLLTALAATLGPTTALSAAELELEEVRPGIWAALQDDTARFNDSNSVVIVSDEDVVVVDSQSDPATVHALVAAIRQLTDKPVRYLVNTHFHSDHTRGNFIYRDEFPGVEILGHPSLLEDVPNRSAPELERALEYYRREIPIAEEQVATGLDEDGQALDDEARATLAAQIARAKTKLAGLETIRWQLPTLTVPQSLTLQRSVGPIEVRAIHAHTRGDLVLHLPKAGVLVTGDVLDDLPFGGHGYPADWLDVLDELAELEWQVMIPGHGSVRTGPEARAHLALVRSMFESMVSAARKAVDSELDLEAAQEAFVGSEEVAALRAQLAGDDPIAGKNFDHFVPSGFERAYLEAKGELPD